MSDEKMWRYDVDADEQFWFVSDHPSSDDWVVTMTCHLTRETKTEEPTKTFTSMMGPQRRNAWQITPFTEYGYARIEIHPKGAEPFVAVEGNRYC